MEGVGRRESLTNTKRSRVGSGFITEHKVTGSGSSGRVWDFLGGSFTDGVRVTISSWTASLMLHYRLVNLSVWGDSSTLVRSLRQTVASSLLAVFGRECISVIFYRRRPKNHAVIKDEEGFKSQRLSFLVTIVHRPSTVFKS